MTGILEVVGITRRFGGLVAVGDVSLSVAAGRIHGLIGPNGAGKTTLFNVVSGVLRPNSGRVLFDGQDVTGLAMHRLVRLGMVRTFQHAQLFPGFSVFRNVLVGLHVHAESGVLAGLMNRVAIRRHRAALEEQARDIVRFVGLQGREDELAGSLSHGHKRMLQVAVGLAPKPRLLLLDEPVAGMNHGDVDRMMLLVRRMCREQGITVVLVEHNMKAVMTVCDRISVLQFGRCLAEGTPAEIAGDPRVIDAYLGVFEDDDAA